ncbi:MAG: uracil phosphoribosyltransferase [Pseudomonadota bacterium]
MDTQHRAITFRPSELEHRYGPGVHILADPLSLTLLARLGSKGVLQPEVGRLCKHLYRSLTQTVLAAEFPRRTTAVPTRMIDTTPLGVWAGETMDPSAFTVVVALARAGLAPAQVTYDFLNEVLEPGRVRQDHLSLGRQVDAAGRVTGALLDAAKIGGSIDEAMLLIPDPMGATGSTVSTALQHYRDTVPGTARKIIAVHLIITPEYLRHVRARHPEVVVYALRLDRGLSPPDVLDTVPGTRWEAERGLTDHHYIVPGAGGLGEVLNNSFV